MESVSTLEGVHSDVLYKFTYFTFFTLLIYPLLSNLLLSITVVKCMLCGQYCRIQEQEQNPDAVICALKTYDHNMRSFKVMKQIRQAPSLSGTGTDVKLGMSPSDVELRVSSDESQGSTDISETADTVTQQSHVINQSSATNDGDAATATNVSNTSCSL